MRRWIVGVIAAGQLVMGFGAEASPQVQGSGPKGVTRHQARKPAPRELLEALGAVGTNCRYKGKKLWGKVKVVSSFPDFKVQVVSSFPDLKVERVSSFPDRCGKWKFVKSFPDFKIKFVKSFPDFKIKFVKSFPGVR